MTSQTELYERLTKNLLWRINNKVYRTITGKKLVFVRTQDLFNYVQELSLKIMNMNFDVVCGIPRSGLMLGSLLSLRLNIKLSTPQYLCENRAWGRGGDLDEKKHNKYPLIYNDIHKVILIDDTCTSGHTMRKAENLIISHNPDIELYKAAFITNSWCKKYLDDYGVIINLPNTVFEWCLPSYYNNIVAADMDGVICEDYKGEKDVVKFIANAKPLFIPKYAFMAIITNRLERYKHETIHWLDKYNVKYNKIYFRDDETNILHKANVLREIKPNIRFYIESDNDAARHLWEYTGIPVLCYSNMRMYS